MTGADVFVDGFPHGTSEGYTRGCKTESHCPAPMPCVQVWMRERSDYGFAKKLAAGVPAWQIVADEQAEQARMAAEAAARDAEAKRVIGSRGGPAERERRRAERAAATAERCEAERAEKTRLREAARAERAAQRAAARKPRELKPCGTSAAYVRGCRCTDCVEANRAYHREYARRRAAGAGKVRGGSERHGTAYGFRNGCKRPEDCPVTPSCAEVVREYDRKRSRAAGRPERVLVGAQDARAHVKALVASGVPVLEVARRADVSKSVVKNLLYGRSPASGRGGRPSVLVKRETAAALLAVRLEDAS